MAGAVQIQNDCCGPVSLPDVEDCTDCCTTSGGPPNFLDVDLSGLISANTPSCDGCAGLPAIYRLPQFRFSEVQCGNIFDRNDGCCRFLYVEEICDKDPFLCEGCGDWWLIIDAHYHKDQAGSTCFVELTAGVGFVQGTDACGCISQDIAIYRSNTFLPHNCRTAGPYTLSLVQATTHFAVCTLTWPPTITADPS